jgi:hypothetical protein
MLVDKSLCCTCVANVLNLECEWSKFWVYDWWMSQCSVFIRNNALLIFQSHVSLKLLHKNLWEHQRPNDKLASPCCLYYSLKNKYKICFILPWYDSITKIVCYLAHGLLKFLIVALYNQWGVRYFIKWGTLGYFVMNNSVWCFAM